jgi:hypothetical protein
MQPRIDSTAVLAPRAGCDDDPGSLGRSEWLPEQVGTTPPPGCAAQPPRVELDAVLHRG